MKTKNLTPFLYGAKVTSRRPPDPEMTVIVRGLFEIRQGESLKVKDELLGQGLLDAEVFAEEDVERQGECLYPGDFADFKPMTDVMLVGTCYPPGKKPAPQCSVTFGVGAWSKTLGVIGARSWADTQLKNASAPEPFTEMPLTYARAFGGPGNEANPVGVGLGTVLPNVELPGALIKSRSEQPKPAVFGPVNPAWAERANKRGKAYTGPSYAKRAPFYAEDFDWSFFNAAPADQRLPGYLKGDEELTFTNLHPTQAVLKTRLPGLRVRAFVKDVNGVFREVPMNLDTVFADLDQGTVCLTWRGLDKVAEDDLLDVVTMLIAAEELGDPRLPEAHYRKRLESFEKDPLGLAEVAALSDLDEGEEPLPPPTDPVSLLLQEKLGNLGAAERKQTQKAMERMLANRPPGNDTKQKIEEALKAKPAPAPVTSGGGVPPMELMRMILPGFDRAKAEADAAGMKIPALENFAKLADSIPGLRPRADGRPPDEPGPLADLSGQDLSNRDLHGIDLTGANLEGTILTGANLEGATLHDARLIRATLIDANISGVDFGGANLTEANLGRANARGARFKGATLDHTSFDQTDLTQADLSNLKTGRLRFTNANLTEATVVGSRFVGSDFEEACLEGADLSGSTFISCLFRLCKGTRANLSRTVLTKSMFLEADFSESSFTEARGENVNFIRAKLSRCDFSYSSFTSSHFSEATANQSKFVAANLKLSRLYRTSLERADFGRSNLFAADLSKAIVTSAKFIGANLYDAKFIKASGSGCDFTDANLKRSTLEKA